MEYGLIGEKLGHSASKEIHEQLADYSYELHPLAKEEFPVFMEEKAASRPKCYHSLQTGSYPLSYCHG